MYICDVTLADSQEKILNTTKEFLGPVIFLVSKLDCSYFLLPSFCFSKVHLRERSLHSYDQNEESRLVTNW